MWQQTLKLPLATTLMLGLVATLLTGVFSTTSVKAQEGARTQTPGTDGVLIGADYWRDEPMILSASLGFEGIIGVEERSEDVVRDAGGTWFGSLTCTTGEEPNVNARTSAPTNGQMAAISTGNPDLSDALPITFSWPVATETIDI